jgi:hypothetical protein
VNGVDLSVGARIEARFKGRGARWFPGKITAVNIASGTLDILYDDGDVEHDAQLQYVRRTHASAASEPAAAVAPTPPTNATTSAPPAEQATSYSVGDKIEARFKVKSRLFTMPRLRLNTAAMIFYTMTGTKKSRPVRNI